MKRANDSKSKLRNLYEYVPSLLFSKKGKYSLQAVISASFNEKYFVSLLEKCIFRDMS